MPTTIRPIKNISNKLIFDLKKKTSINFVKINEQAIQTAIAVVVGMDFIA
jgi:ribosomal protein L18E